MLVRYPRERRWKRGPPPRTGPSGGFRLRLAGFEARGGSVGERGALGFEPCAQPSLRRLGSRSMPRVSEKNEAGMPVEILVGRFLTEAW